jgi:hypothetical protein
LRDFCAAHCIALWVWCLVTQAIRARAGFGAAEPASESIANATTLASSRQKSERQRVMPLSSPVVRHLSTEKVDTWTAVRRNPSRPIRTDVVPVFRSGAGGGLVLEDL